MAAGGVPHTVQELTIFLPDLPPPPDGGGLYPTLLYSPAGAFQQGQATESNQTVGGLFGEHRALKKTGHGPIYVAINNPRPTFPSPSTEASTLNPPCGFLDEALNRGWALVTVGTTGWNSWPTCAQDEDCTFCQNTSPDPCGAMPGPCRDTNLWIDPSSAAWNDFNMFSGEKEFTWARQWIGENGTNPLYNLDTNRVVVCGTSTGAIYS